MKKKFGILKIRNLNFIAMNEWILAIQIEAIWFYMYDFVCMILYVWFSMYDFLCMILYV